MLYELQVAEVNWILGFHEQTVFNERLVDVSAEHLEGLLQDLRRQVCVKKGRVPSAASDVKHGDLVLVLPLF